MNPLFVSHTMLQNVQRIPVAGRHQPFSSPKGFCKRSPLCAKPSLLRTKCLANNDDDEPPVIGDWRDFRAKLVLQEGEASIHLGSQKKNRQKA